MTGTSVVQVQEPKFEVMSADYHRNGVSGRGFYVGIVKHWGDSGEGEEPRLLQIVALPSEDGTATEDVSKMTFDNGRSEEHTSELQSLMRISYAVFCLKKKQNTHKIHNTQ